MFEDIEEGAKLLSVKKNMLIFKALEWDDGYIQTKEYIDKNQNNIEDWSLIDKHDDIIYLVLQISTKDPNHYKHKLFIPYELITREDCINFPIDDSRIV